MRGRRIYLFVFLIFFLLRFWGIQFGLPDDGIHPTENFSIFQSITYRATGDFKPQNFQHPALFQYLLTAISFIFNLHYTHFPYFYLLGRFISLIASLLALFFLYRLARELFNSGAFGLLVSCFLGFNLLSVKYSHYAVPDSLSLLFIVLSIWHSLRILVRPGRKNYLLCGLFCGLSIASKFSGLISIAFLSCAHLFSESKRGKHLILFLSLLTVFLTFFLLCPYHAFFFKNAIADFSGYLGEKGYFLSPQIKASGFFTYPFIILPQVFGIPGFLFALAGLFILFSQEKKKAWFISLPSLLYLLAIGKEMGGTIQNMLPLVPILSICCGIFFFWLKVRQVNKYIFPIALYIVLIPQFFSSVIFDYFLLQKDTRVLAEEWLLKNVKENSRIGFERYTPYDLGYIPKSKVQEKFLSTYFTPSLSDYPASYFKQQGFDYIVTSGFRQQAYAFFCKATAECEATDNYATYDKQFKSVAEFRPPMIFKVTGISLPWGTWPHNPGIKIYKVR